MLIPIPYWLTNKSRTHSLYTTPNSPVPHDQKIAHFTHCTLLLIPQYPSTQAHYYYPTLMCSLDIFKTILSCIMFFLVIDCEIIYIIIISLWI